MRLFRPNPGEIVDRQTILQLKAEHGSSPDMAVSSEVSVETKGTLTRSVMKNASKVNIQPFLDESELCQQNLEQYWFPDIANSVEKQTEFDKLHSALLEINSMLWRLEDRARILKSAPDKFQDLAARNAAEVLFTINDLNDRRAETVKQINSLWGIQAQEKMYV